MKTKTKEEILALLHPDAPIQVAYLLEDVSYILLDDFDVLKAACLVNGTAIRFASDRLRSDIHFCLQCAKLKPDAIIYFLGEAALIFKQHNNDVRTVEIYLANNLLLSKLKLIKPISQQLFKRNQFEERVI